MPFRLPISALCMLFSACLLTSRVIAESGSSRAAMLISSPSDPKNPSIDLGSAVWSIIPATSGQASTLAVRIEIDVPDQKMHASVTIRKNADVSLPATHTLDLRMTFANGAQIKGLKDIGLPQLRKDDAATGDSLAGVRVKINDSYYLVGLTRSDTDAAHNLDLLARRNWLDFPLLLRDGRTAKLTFAKGDVGDKVMVQAFDAWKGQPVENSSAPSQEDRQVDDPNAIEKLIGNARPENFILAQKINAWMSEAYLRCWNQPSSMPTGVKYVAQVRVSLNPTGSLSGQPQLVNPPSDPAWRDYSESAMRAVLKCNPLRVPPAFVPYFEKWKVKVVHFDPQDAASSESVNGDSKTDDVEKFLDKMKTEDTHSTPSISQTYTTEIPLQKLDGTLVAPVQINGALTLNFIVDSGATDVSVPADVVLTLIRTGTLLTDDFLGTKTYRLADGSTFPSTTFRIRSLKVGNREIENVVASVAKVEGSLLLGQSFLNRFTSWSIDNQRQLLLLN